MVDLYKAVIDICVFCRERWPVLLIDGKYRHVGPYSRHPEPFSHKCEANQIRQVMKYEEYKGGPKVKFPVPEVSTLTEHFFNPKNRSFFRNLSTCTLDVNSWPEWKRSYTFDGKEKKETPEELEASNTRARREIRQLDAYEYYAYQPCTDHCCYVPRRASSGWDVDKKPSCNWGIGCISCWAKYQKLADQLEEANPVCY